jgi:uncharacterized protein Smg (DUF494 family)
MRGGSGIVSRGSGRLMKRIVEIVEGAPERAMSRKDLDDVLVVEGFFPQNIPRALRSLACRHLVALKDNHTKERSIVSLPRKVRYFSDDEIAEILKEIGGRK